MHCNTINIEWECYCSRDWFVPFYCAMQLVWMWSHLPTRSISLSKEEEEGITLPLGQRLWSRHRGTGSTLVRVTSSFNSVWETLGRELSSSLNRMPQSPSPMPMVRNISLITRERGSRRGLGVACDYIKGFWAISFPTFVCSECLQGPQSPRCRCLLKYAGDNFNTV